jgi:hypothetical protein
MAPPLHRHARIPPAGRKHSTTASRTSYSVFRFNAEEKCFTGYCDKFFIQEYGGNV